MSRKNHIKSWWHNAFLLHKIFCYIDSVTINVKYMLNILNQAIYINIWICFSGSENILPSSIIPLLYYCYDYRITTVLVCHDEYVSKYQWNSNSSIANWMHYMTKCMLFGEKCHGKFFPFFSLLCSFCIASCVYQKRVQRARVGCVRFHYRHHISP